MGALIDAEPNGIPDPNALGDDNTNLPDEDGVVLTSPMIPGQLATVDITVSAPGFIDAWIDFGSDGGWVEPIDQIFVSVPVNPGLNSLGFTVPGASVPFLQTFARFRFSTVGGLTYTGQAPDGEVEDYGIFIEESDYKWIQTPDLTPTGIDVNASVTYILADDFECREPGRLTEFYVWGSWLDDFIPDPMAVSFTLSLHADIPDTSSPTGYSMPGDVVWMKTFNPGEFFVDIWADQILEGWMNPPEDYFFPGDTICWLYTFFVQPEDAFHQIGMPDEPIVYWLDVQAWPEFPTTQFGWKTSLEHWNDDAVWGDGIEPYPGPWDELRYPPGHDYFPESIDLAFAIRSTYGTDVPEEEEIPREFGLYQNIPNPFNPTTTVGYDVPAGGGRVRIEVFDVSGRLVTTLVDEVLPEGRRSVAWHGVDERGAELPSGVYFYRMDAGDYVETRKMLLLK